ncbi:MAG TPA: DUF1015 domain-containing protein [Tepidisphaeraceae bacterium]
MAQIRPFRGVHFAKRNGRDISSLIAPPYDVLSEQDRANLQAKDPHNIVNIDLPHVPPKSAGPDEVYDKANIALQSWLKTGVLERDGRPALYPYTQSYEHGGRTFHRRGFIALVHLSPFGEGHVFPHEKTHAGAIEDRMKLMQYTGMQLSPIFGLFSDQRNEITGMLYRGLSQPDFTATLDGVRNDLWSLIDAEVENRVIDWMKHKPVYIADGHHRYTTALQYQKMIEQQENGGRPLPPAHPANYCMFVLVGMQDDGLLILPTHRLIGGLGNFDINTFQQTVAGTFDVLDSNVTPDQLPAVVESLEREPSHSFALYDGRAKKLYYLRLKRPDVLKQFEPKQSDAWRQLDVAILQRYLLDEILQPHFAAKELVKGYTHDAGTIASEVDGTSYQLALILRATPLHALEELGKHGEVMPQKSTFFYPKLATGMMIYPLK